VIQISAHHSADPSVQADTISISRLIALLSSSHGGFNLYLPPGRREACRCGACSPDCTLFVCLHHAADCRNSNPSLRNHFCFPNISPFFVVLEGHELCCQFSTRFPAQCGSVQSKYSFPLIQKRWIFTQVLMSLVNLASALICLRAGTPGEGGGRSSKFPPPLVSQLSLPSLALVGRSSAFP